MCLLQATTVDPRIVMRTFEVGDPVADIDTVLGTFREI
jgi:hypothetical protein